MQIEPGTILARYRVESKLGEGGMGVVWKATDTALRRVVALKVLPAAVAADPERIARFEREARTLAALNHPNIAAIYGLEADGPTRVLAMEFVPGETLAARIARGPIPVPEAIAIARKIADALESAHERAVVHRDLKPANVVVTPEGEVKLLDFGLARALAPEGDAPDDSPTISMVTRGDVILGTAAYMSPEQARGRTVDRRSDIWSFGLVLFEMLAGRRVFEGETTSDLLAAVLRQDIPWERLPADVPAGVRALLERCLTRDPRERLRDIGEARIALARPEAPRPLEAARNRRPAWARLAVAALVGAAIAAAAFLTRPAPPPPGPASFALASVTDPQRATPALAPNGRAIAYVDQGALWVRTLDQLDARRVAQDADLRNPFWSADSRTVGYFSGRRVLKVAATGGTPEVVAEMADAFGQGGDGAVWEPSGRILLSQGTTAGVVALPASGGDPAPFFAPDTTQESDYHEPCALPGGRGLIAVVHRRSGYDAIAVLHDGKRTIVLEQPGFNLARPQYAPQGVIVFERVLPGHGVWAVPFSLSRLAVTGAPFLVVADGTGPTVASDGTLAYARTSTRPVELCWVDREGKNAATAAVLGNAADLVGMFDVSPDGQRVVAEVAADLHLYDLTRGTDVALTDDRGPEMHPRWSPDGRSVIYQAALKLPANPAPWAACRLDIERPGHADTLVSNGAIMPSFTPDGRSIVFVRGGSGGWELETAAASPHSTPRAFAPLRRRTCSPRVSPDGRWVVFGVDATSAEQQILLRSSDPASAATQVVGAGQWAQWNARGDRVEFVHHNEVMEVTVGAGNPPVLGRPTRLFTRPAVELTMPFDWEPQFAVHGDRFLVLRSQAEEHGAAIVLLEHWKPAAR